jgi:hypothetical protein
MLARIATGTRSLRSSHPRLSLPTSILSPSRSNPPSVMTDPFSSVDSTIDFDFDDLIVNSQVYRRAMRNAQRPDPIYVRDSKFVEVDLIDLSDDPVPAMMQSGNLNAIMEDLQLLDESFHNEQQSEDHGTGGTFDHAAVLSEHDEAEQDSQHDSTSPDLAHRIHRKPVADTLSAESHHSRSDAYNSSSPSSVHRSNSLPGNVSDDASTIITLDSDCSSLGHSNSPASGQISEIDVVHRSSQSLFDRSQVVLVEMPPPGGYDPFTGTHATHLQDHRVHRVPETPHVVDEFQVARKDISIAESLLFHISDTTREMLPVLFEAAKITGSSEFKKLASTLNQLVDAIPVLTDYLSTYAVSDSTVIAQEFADEFCKIRTNIMQSIRDEQSKRKNNSSLRIFGKSKDDARLQKSILDLISKIERCLPTRFLEYRAGLGRVLQISGPEMQKRAIENSSFPSRSAVSS